MPHPNGDLHAEHSRARVLIVDDDAASRRLLKFSLEKNYDVVECHDGSETLQLLQGAGPALVVLDYQMPDLNGAQVCEIIRSHPDSEVAQCPIIMLTGHSQADHEVECLRAGADDFVTKPVNMAVLRARIDTHLRLHSMRRLLMDQNQVLEDWRTSRELDLEAARLTQQAILPSRLPIVPGWSFASRYHPLLQIGGDIYDWLRTHDGSLLVWISDATGHGASAALLTTLSKLLFRHAAADTHEPGKIMDHVEHEFESVFRAHTYMTAGCLLITPDHDHITYCGAGHPPLLIARASGEIESIASNRPPLGLHKTGGSAEARAAIGPGDAILLYTDGLYELHDGAGKRIGPAGLAEMLAPANGDQAHDWLAHLTKKLEAASAPNTFPDDVAVFAAVRE
jgi:phosphoserine phosphatase RsbU/P